MPFGDDVFIFFRFLRLKQIQGLMCRWEPPGEAAVVWRSGSKVLFLPGCVLGVIFCVGPKSLCWMVSIF